MKYKKFKKLMERFNSEEVIHTSGYVQPVNEPFPDSFPTSPNDYMYPHIKTTSHTGARWMDELIIDGSQKSVDNYSSILGWLINNYPETYSDFVDQQAEQFDLFCKKHKDYGPDNLVRDTVQESVESILERMKDKLNRVHKLNRENSQPENESLIDSLNDISNYANISIIFLKGHWGK